MEHLVLKEKQGHIGFVILNRPDEMNTFTVPFANQLVQVLTDLENDPEVKVVPLEDLEAETMKLAEKVASKSPSSLKIGKEGLNRIYEHTYHENLIVMDDLFAALCATDDAEEGVAAFLEKRKPHWKNQ